MNSYIIKALNNLENANISGYFEEIDNVVIPSHLKPIYAELKSKFIQGLKTHDSYQQLVIFARNLDEYLADNNQNNNNENHIASISQRVTKKAQKPTQTMASSKKDIDVKENTVPQKGFEYAFIIGIVLTFGIVIYVLVKECVSKQAFDVIRFLLPIGFAGLGAWLPGSFGFKNDFVKAVGAVGLLAMAFFFNPAQYVFSGKSCEDITVQGIVKINDVRAENISVSCLEIKKSDNTDSFGGFVITDVSTRLLDSKDSLSFLVKGFKEKKYLIDKSSIDKYNFEIYLTDKDKVSQIIEPKIGEDITPVTTIKEEESKSTQKQKTSETSIEEVKANKPEKITFKLQGRMTDDNNSGVKNLTVILENSEFGEIEVTTDPNGYFNKPIPTTKDVSDLKFDVFVRKSDGNKNLVGNRKFESSKTTNLKITND